MGEVLHYRDFRKPAERWSNTKPRDTAPSEMIPCDLGGFIVDPGPYVPPPYLAPENDSA